MGAEVGPAPAPSGSAPDGGGPFGLVALGALRGARRKRHLAGVPALWARFRAAWGLFVAAAVVLGAGSAFGGTPVRGLELVRVRQDGPALVGLAVALAAAVALVSGGRGGPLLLEAPDVAHLLTAPLPRRSVLAGPSLALLRFGAAVGASIGAVVGVLSFERLPGGLLAWAFSGALAGAAGALFALGAGLVASGLHIGRPAARALAAALVAWSAADLVGRTTTSPMTLLGTVATFPLGLSGPVLAKGLGGLAAALVLAGVGVAAAGGLSLEQAERRSRLVGGVALGAVVFDLRPVLLPPRVLEDPRAVLPRSSRTCRKGSRKRRRGAVAWRDWRALRRSPGHRLARLGALGVLAGLAARGAFSGPSPLVVVAGLALYAAGLDLMAPLSEEVVHEELAAQVPKDAGWLATRHLVVPLGAMVGVAAVGIASAMAFGHPVLVAEVGVPTAVCAVPAAVVSAAVRVLRPGAGAAPLFAEPAGAAFRVGKLVPPGIATVGTVALLAGKAAVGRHEPALDAAVNAAAFSLIVPVAAYGWLKARGRGEPGATRAGQTGRAPASETAPR